MARDLEIVLIDATAPFGHGRMLPRGLLREPLAALRRADVVVLTRSNEADATAKADILRAISKASGGKPVAQASHKITGYLDVKGRPVAADPTSMQAILFAGIGNFQGFRRCVDRLGVRVLAAYEYPDHHYYSTEEIEGLVDVATTLEANVLLTTEKDAVKLVGRWNDERCRLLALHLEIEFDATGDRILTAALDRVLKNG
jgi:tetraacyldisaccharide 4'-kinase